MRCLSLESNPMVSDSTEPTSWTYENVSTIPVKPRSRNQLIAIVIVHRDGIDGADPGRERRVAFSALRYLQ